MLSKLIDEGRVDQITDYIKYNNLNKTLITVIARFDPARNNPQDIQYIRSLGNHRRTCNFNLIPNYYYHVGLTLLYAHRQPLNLPINDYEDREYQGFFHTLKCSFSYNTVSKMDKHETLEIENFEIFLQLTAILITLTT